MSCHWLEAKQSVLNLKVEKWKDRPCGKVESSGLGQQGLGVCPGSLGLEQIAVLWEGGNVHNVMAKKEIFKCSACSSFLSEYRTGTSRVEGGEGILTKSNWAGRVCFSHNHRSQPSQWGSHTQSQEQRKTTAHMLCLLVLSLGNRATHGGLGHTLEPRANAHWDSFPKWV